MTYKIECFKGIYILTKHSEDGKITCVTMSRDKEMIHNMKMGLEDGRITETSNQACVF
jgi:hypothetical protein